MKFNGGALIAISRFLIAAALLIAFRPEIAAAQQSSLGKFRAGSLYLYSGQSVSYSGYTLAMQPDGNLVYYAPWGAVWSSQTNGQCTRCLMAYEPSGNLVVYNLDNWKTLYWSNSTGSTLFELSWTAPYLSTFNGDQQLAWSISGTAFSSMLSEPHWDPSSRFAVHDQYGRGLDALKLDQEPTGQFVGVYHNMIGPDHFCLRLATTWSVQSDQWTHVADIDCDYASQGELKRLADGRYLLAYEKNPSGTRPYIRVMLYNSITDLLAGRIMRDFTTLGNPDSNASGTPNFRWIQYDGNPDTMRIEIGFHFNRRNDARDVNAIAFLDGFQRWSWSENTNLNNLIYPFSSANIGDRTFVVYQGRPYTLIEVQLYANDWNSWRLYLHDEIANTVTPINYYNSHSSSSMGNPTLSVIFTGTQVKILGTAFMFNGDAQGTHLFTRTIMDRF